MKLDETGALDVANKKAMEAELNELRYYLERNVEQRTEQLVRRIALLEHCNAALCDKLVLARSELTALKQRPARNLPDTGDAGQNDGAGWLYAMGNWAKNLIGARAQYGSGSRCG